MLGKVTEEKCGVCGVTGVRLYRPYGEFRRPERDRCNACVTDRQRPWYVPLVVDKSDGLAWGYTSIPDDDYYTWLALPEASDTAPQWRQCQWRDS